MNSDAVDIYDIATDSFDYTEISQARQGIVSAVLKDDTSGVETLVLIGGITFGGNNKWLYEGQSKHSQRIDFLTVRTGTPTLFPKVIQNTPGRHTRTSFMLLGALIIYTVSWVELNVLSERWIALIINVSSARNTAKRIFRPPCPPSTVRHPRTEVVIVATVSNPVTLFKVCLFSKDALKKIKNMCVCAHLFRFGNVFVEMYIFYKFCSLYKCTV